MGDTIIGVKIQADTAAAENALREVRRGVDDLSKSAAGSTGITGALSSAWGFAADQLSQLKTAAMGATAAFGLLAIAKKALEAVDFAATIEQSNRALSIIANTMGMTSAAAMKSRDSLANLGITTSAATNAVAQFIKGGMPLEKLNQLATAAQGAAISYKMMTGETISSSEALNKMIRSIMTGNVTELHTLGINVMMKDALRNNKIATGESSASVDNHRLCHRSRPDHHTQGGHSSFHQRPDCPDNCPGWR